MSLPQGTLELCLGEEKVSVSLPQDVLKEGFHCIHNLKVTCCVIAILTKQYCT